MNPLKIGLTGQIQSNPNNDSSPNIRACKVVSVILDDTHPMFKQMGEWSSIGTIFFAYLDTSTDAVDSTVVLKDNFAIPLFPNIKYPPLLNEVVYTIMLPTIPSGNTTQDTVLYYFSSINLLNSPNHNAYILDNNSKGVKFNQLGIPYRNAQDTTTKVNLGQNFQENVSVRPLLAIEGDYIFEGRHGNSIRFGGSHSSKITQWKSPKGQSNYFILSGRSQTTEENIPVIENLNSDDYIIAGFSDHVVDIDLPSLNFGSYNINTTNHNVTNESLHETNTGTESNRDQITPTINNINMSTTENDNVADIFNSNEQETVEEIYTEEVQEFVEPDYVYVLQEDTIKERAQVYSEESEVHVQTINVIPIPYITKNQFTLICKNAILASKYLTIINQTLTVYKINNNKRIAHFLSQCIIESQNFTRFEEIGAVSYFSKYDKRQDLGNNNQGDGYKFRGRGAIQLTGKWNYKTLNSDLKYGNDLVLSNPDVVSKYPLNILSAGWYWNKRSINKIADTDNISAVRKLVQGSTTDRLTDVTREYYRILNILTNGSA